MAAEWTELRDLMSEQSAVSRHVGHLFVTDEVDAETRALFLLDVGRSMTDGARLARALARDAHGGKEPEQDWSALRVHIVELDRDAGLTDQVLRDPCSTRQMRALFLSLLACTAVKAADMAVELAHAARGGEQR